MRIKVTIHNKERSESIEVSKDLFTLGRSLDCDLSLNDANISRLHATVEVVHNKLYIVDKNSSNGTLVNGRKIPSMQSIEVHKGDVIQFGKSAIVVELELLSESKPIEFQSVPKKEIKSEVTEPLKENPPSQTSLPSNLPRIKTSQTKATPEKEKKRFSEDSSVSGNAGASNKAGQGLKVITPQSLSADLEHDDEDDDGSPLERLSPPNVKVGSREHEEKALAVEKKKEPVQRAAENVESRQKSEKAEVVKTPAELSPVEQDRLVIEAKKRAAQIVLQSELDAEKAVQSIYEKAKHHQKMVDEKVALKIRSAKAKADDLILQAENDGKEIVKEARRMAQQMREEVDESIQKIKAEIIAEAQSEKKILLENAQKYIEDRNKDTVEAAQQKALDLVHEAELKAEAIIQTAQQLEQEKHQELAELLTQVETKQLDLQSLEEAFDSISAQELELRNSVASLQQEFAEGKDVHAIMSQNLADLQKKNDQLSKIEAEYQLRIESLRGEVETLQAKFESEKANFQEKVSREKAEIERAEDERREKVRLEFQKQAQKLEQQMLVEVVRNKDSLAEDIYFHLEKDLINLVGAEEWGKISHQLRDNVHEVIDGKVAALSSEAQSVGAKAALAVHKKSKDGFKQLATGLLMGVALLFAGQQGYKYIQNESSPMKKRAIAAAEERQKDLEARRFNPPQVREIKSTYTDSVIYTKNFVEVYTDLELQKKFYKQASVYLLKTWRVEESKAIEVLSIAVSLVNELKERRQKIHPDYVKDGIKKMQDLEKAALARMKTALGSDVRVESFKKFETNFFNKALSSKYSK